MKTLIIMLITSLSLFSQNEYTSQENQDAMAKLKVFVGEWEGDSWYMGRDGKVSSTMKEVLQCKLDKTAILVEGKGYNGDKLIHNAIALITYNPYTKQYNFKSHLSNGRSTDAVMIAKSENTFEWSFETPNGMKFRYEVTFTENTWTEEGFMARDAVNFVKFMGMNLVRVH